MINTRKMRYTSDAMAAFKASGDYINTHTCPLCMEDAFGKSNADNYSNRVWSHMQHELHKPSEPKASDHNIGRYPFTSEVASWVENTMANFQPDSKVLDLVKPFSEGLHEAFDAERITSSGLHDLKVIETTYQVTLEAAAAILLAADATDDPIDLQDDIHSSKAGGDEQFAPWSLLLTGLECNPPIIAMFPYYLMLCQAFTFEPTSAQENYVYAALTGVDWAKEQSEFNNKLESFERRARSAVPLLDDKISGQDRSFWRISHAYLGAMNACENSRPFRAPRRAAIPHNLDFDLILAMRGLDTIGSAYMCSDGAAWLDRAGIDSLVGSGLSNDVMDLHADIRTGETRNLLRLLYPDNLGIHQAMTTVSTILSGLLGELYRGHRRARLSNREDGRVAATSPAYSFCRAQHRRIFETLEMYIDRYPKFWDWTREIFQMAKAQVTELGLDEPLVCALKRAGKLEPLPESPTTSFYDTYYELIETAEPLEKRRPLGVSGRLSQVVYDLHRLWHIELRAPNKEPGWGRRFDVESDKLFGDAGRILLENQNTMDMHKFGIAYGRLSTALPYVAYHTVDAIIMAFGPVA